MKKVKIEWDLFNSLLTDFAERLLLKYFVHKKLLIYGVPRGGLIVASQLALLHPTIFELVYDLKAIDEEQRKLLIIIDDICDSGRTLQAYKDQGYITEALVRNLKAPDILSPSSTLAVDYWVEFPWEVKEVGCEDAVTRILQFISEDCQREGLQDTPKRVAKFYESFITKGDLPDFNFTTFKNEGNDQMIVVKDIPFYSICEHHLLPFFGKAAVAYIPKDKIVGLSKIPRVVNFFANRPQNQERITQQVGDFLRKSLGRNDGCPEGECSVAVILEARHMCMEMRGIKSIGANTVTSFISGDFRTQAVRDEFFNLK